MSSIQPHQKDVQWVDSPFFVFPSSTESQPHHNPNLFKISLNESFFSFLNEDEIKNSASLSSTQLYQSKKTSLPENHNRDIPYNSVIAIPHTTFFNIMTSALSILSPEPFLPSNPEPILSSRLIKTQSSNLIELTGLFCACHPFHLLLGEKKLNDGSLFVGMFSPQTGNLRGGCILNANGNSSFGEYDLKTGHLDRGVKIFAGCSDDRLAVKIAMGIFDANTGHLISGASCRMDNSCQRVTYDPETDETTKTELDKKDLNKDLATYAEKVYPDNSRSIGLFDPETGLLLNGCRLSSDGTCCFGRFHSVTQHLIDGYKRFALENPHTGNHKPLTHPKIQIGEFHSATGALLKGYRVLFNGTKDCGQFSLQTGDLTSGKRFFV